MIYKACCIIEELPYHLLRSSIKFQGHTAQKLDDLNPILSKITRLVAAIEFLRFALFYVGYVIGFWICVMYSILLLVSHGLHNKT